MRHPIGNQTAFTAAHWREPYQFALRHGFGLFEWFSDRKGGLGWDFALCETSSRKALAREAASAGMVFTVHAPWDSQPQTPEGRAGVLSSVRFAADVGAGLVAIHLPGREDEAVWVDAMKEPLHWAEQAGIVLCLENTVAVSPADCERIFAAMRQLYGQAAPIGLCFDMGHANLCAKTRNDYVRFLDTLAPEVNIVHVHLHENWGQADQHLVLFTGPAAHDPRGVSNMVNRLLGRGYQGGFVLEQWPEPPELLLAAARRLDNLLAHS